MAKDSSFDIVSKIDMQETVNAVDQAMREVSGRYDFKNSNTKIELNKDERKITITTIDDYKVRAAYDVLKNKLIKRGLSLKAFSGSEPVEQGLNKVVINITIQDGIPQEKAKELVKFIKETKKKIQASIQKDVVRVSGKSKDDLQEIMEMLKLKDFDIDMQFVNYR